MQQEKAIDEKKFFEEILLAELDRLQKNGFYYLSIFVISQSIELIGAYLDKKPIRARGQSKIRFRKAIDVLFPEKYKVLNRNDWLYDKLRSHLSHSLFPSTWLFLTSYNANSKLKHLKKHNGKLVFIAEELLEDFRKACELLILMLEEGKVRRKKLGNDFTSFGA